MNSNQARPMRRAKAERQRSGAVAAMLSFIFPGLGQAYIGDRRRALLFAAPAIALIIFIVLFVFAAGGLSRVAIRFLDPGFVTVALGVFVAYGMWQALSFVDAWRRGRRTTWSPFVAAGLALLLVFVQVVAVFGYGVPIIEDEQRIYTGNPLDATAPPATPSPTPTAPGETPNPEATPTQRPPDYIDPRDQPTDEPEPSIEPGPTPGFNVADIDAEADGLLNVLLVGLDWQPGRDSKRTDTMLVVSANADTGELLMFSFPRDTARFPLYHGGTYNGKLNTFAGYANRNPEIYPDGGLRALADQTGYMLGIPIDYHASVNMPGFMEVVEQVGGITVNNTRNIQDDTLQFYLSPGEHRLGPADALRYVRTRHGSGGDFGRVERQQQVLAALRRELLKPENLGNLPAIVDALSQVISTDFPPGQIDQLVQLADQVEAEPSQSWIFRNPQWATHLTGGQACGRPITYPRMDKIAELSIELFGDKSLWKGHKPPGPPPLPECPQSEQ